jgi:hypothetical protein
MKLIGGKVKSISEGTGQAQGKVVNVVLEDGTQVAFWDNESRKMATRFRLARVKVGAFISILAMLKDTTKANAINFKYNGIWDFKEDLSSLKPTLKGKITGIDMTDNGIEIALDNQGFVEFQNYEKGYQFMDRLIDRQPCVGDTLSVVIQDGKIINFAINDNWEIHRSISAIIGNVAFVDECVTTEGNPSIKVNISIFDHKDKNTGENIFKNCYIYFDNENNPDMVERVKENVKTHSPIAIVGSKHGKNHDKEIFRGYYFINI